MQTATEVDASLVERAREATGIEDMRDLVNEGLRLLVKTRRQVRALALRGQIDWQGDLAAWRRDEEPGDAR